MALLLAPDLAAAGFIFGPRVGVAAYNSTHRPIVPLLVMTLGLVTGSRMAVILPLIWLAHIGMDRAANYGLKEVASRPVELGPYGGQPF